MLHLLPEAQRDCERVSRRGLLQLGTLGALGISLPQLIAAKQAAAASGGSARDVNCILVWTQGGTSHHDTFDPKPNAPLSVRGEFNVIDTAVPGVQFTEIVPNMARELHRFAVLRSWNPQNGSHGVADQYVMSGRRFNAAVQYPTYGSVVSWFKGFRSALPPFVQLGTSIDRRFGGGSSGVLGSEHNAFEMTADPKAKDFNVRDISLPSGVDLDRKVLADMAVRDAEGFLTIVDRKKDMIVSGGFNVFPREIEDVLATHPAVSIAAVIGVPDEKWGEAVKAVVVPRPGETIDVEALKGLVKERKGPIYAPKSVDVVEALPLTAVGKPDKKVLRARYWGGSGRGVH